MTGHVFVLETDDLINYLEGKMKVQLPLSEVSELFEQLFILLRHHHPCDLSDRKVLIYDSLPSLRRHVNTVGEYEAFVVVCDKIAYSMMIELYKRLQAHYLYDHYHRPQFILRGLVGKNIILELPSAGASNHGF